jgi:uncharacterized membrane protein YoaK (UPF0700 family)
VREQKFADLCRQMLRHTGEKRSLKHNLRLAILLCLNAGFINAAGFFAFQVLTTNVTGHAALMAVSIATPDYKVVKMAALWLLLFLSGAFFSGYIISKTGREKPTAYTLPILIIILLIASVAVFGRHYTHQIYQTAVFAGGLLFAMGMQNAMVSMISGSVVRTTHLTGMFTDLGIDLSILATQETNTDAVKSRILLRGSIIASFLIGGIVGSIAFLHLAYYSFYIPCSIMLTALFYDYFRVSIKRVVRRG